LIAATDAGRRENKGAGGKVFPLSFFAPMQCTSARPGRIWLAKIIETAA